MATILRTATTALALFLFLSCGCTRRATSTTAPEFYSGIFSIEESGQATLTDCATRIRFSVAAAGDYEKVRGEYVSGNIHESNPLRIEFYGKVTGENLNAPSADMPHLRDIRIDSLLSFSITADCATDYTVPGIYRKIQDGPAEILKLKPDYTYTLENFTTDNSRPFDQGVWYRTSEMTLVVKSSKGGLVSFQIIPAQESISATDGREPLVYRKEWL